MRRFFICFLLCLMPLRLWAGVWMPLAENSAATVGAQVGTSQALTKHQGMKHEGMKHESVNCHETLHASESHQAASTGLAAQPVGDLTAELAMQKEPCHDGHCQFCGVCHQTASPVDLMFVAPSVQSYPLPLGALSLEAGVASPPLIKPPIS